MANILDKILNTMGYSKSPHLSLDRKPKPKEEISAPLPTGRVSIPPYNQGIANVIMGLSADMRVVNPSFNREVIPLIRNLTTINANFSQALQNIVFLGNTGHRINFDKNLKPEYIEKMRHHLTNKHKQWASGMAGMDGLVNRMFTQLMISGALSTEWVPSKDLKGIESVLLVSPEDIFYVLDKRRTKYIAYQRVMMGLVGSKSNNFVKLNEATYQYYALNGDGEIPYGYPPYLAALEAFDVQKDMHSNIRHVIKLMGLLGFLGVSVEQPDPREDETDDQYLARLNTLLINAKAQIDQGFKDGVVVGFKDRWEMDYHAFSKEIGQAVELYKQNELQFFSGLKQDATLAGRDYNSSESQITVIFMKLLSELKNIQGIIKTNLEFGYALELKLAGFQFDYLNVEFNRSTIQDDLKFQQALEYKVRNYIQLYLMGTIDEFEFANVMGYEAPHEKTPRVPLEVLAGQSPKAEGGSDEDKDKNTKNKSAKKERAKAKPQGAKKQ